MSLSLSDYPQDSGGFFSVSVFLHLCLSSLLSSLFLSLPPISVSDHFLGTLPWGSRSPVCRKPDPHHLFFIFWKRQLHFLPEGRGGGEAGCLAPPLSLPPSSSEPIPSPSSLPQGGQTKAFPVLGHCGTENRALIQSLPCAAHHGLGEATRPLLIHHWFTDSGKSENSRHRESPGG